MIYVILFIFSYAFTYYIRKVAIKKSLVDIPNERSSHTTPTPHGGGIAIAITWFIGISYLYYINDINNSLYFSLLVGVIISVVSYLDDLYELSAKVRLVTQFFVAMLGLWLLDGLQQIDLLFFSIENQIITNVFALFTIVWFINLYNFLDGIDGYAGSEAIFLGLAAFLLFGGSHFLVLIFAVLGFLIWNWHKAKIFMGDVGSTLLGYNIAVFTIYYANIDSLNLWIWITLFGLFWFDATITLLKRYINGGKLSKAHKKHAYQRLVQSGWSHNKVVIFSILVNFLLFCFIYYISNVFIAFLLSISLLYVVIKYIDKKKSFN
ncbi:glycosyltransferase family 4 protein [Sulfurimonas sp.]|uniref:MraY family glycosyltransferase n=1 Tax=Sulfurimonas sp. TaxID=2022749 RepID=UPI0035650A7C